jgi:hypothetical protein
MTMTGGMVSGWSRRIRQAQVRPSMAGIVMSMKITA